METKLKYTTSDPDKIIVNRALDYCKQMELEKAWLHAFVTKHGEEQYILFKPVKIVNPFEEVKTPRSIMLVQYGWYGENGKEVYEAGLLHKVPGKGLIFADKPYDRKVMKIIGQFAASLTRDL